MSRSSKPFGWSWAVVSALLLLAPSVGAEESPKEESSATTSESSESESDAEASNDETETHVLKVASLAPENSTWAQSFEETAREVETETEGAVEIKLYPGGVMGDEPAMVRKMRTGQLDGAALTNTGLGEIEPKILALQLPLMFKNWKEVDHVRDEMSNTFREMLTDKGFTLLSWGDVGFNYLFSSQPVHEPSELTSAKLWVWESDPIMRTVADVADVNAVPLAVTDVLPSLSTGVIDSFTNSPYGAVSMQWYTRAEHVTNLRLGVIVGGFVMRTESLDELPDEHRKTLREIAAENGREMLETIRQDNKQAIQTIEGSGIEVVEPENMESWQSIARETRSELTGDVFPESLVETIRTHLENYRE